MQTTELFLEIISLEKPIFSGMVRMVVVSGILGEVGILPGHIPFLTLIKPGQIKIILKNEENSYYYVSKGILDVKPNHVIILADTVLAAKDINEADEIRKKTQMQRLLMNKHQRKNITNLLVKISQVSAKLRTVQLSTKDKKH